MRLSLQQKEQFFHELRELLRSGRSLPQALDNVAGARQATLRQVAQAMRAGGDGTAAGFFAATPAFSAMDREVIAGGEGSGRLDEAAGYLSDYYAALARARRRVVYGLLYPFFLIHLAALLLAVPAMMADGPEAFVAQVLVFLGAFYAVFGLGILLVWAAVRWAERSAAGERFLQALPVVGKARVALISARFCLLMGMLVRNSGGILGAVTRAGTGSGSALFREGAASVVGAVQGGDSLGAAVARTGAFPEPVDRAFQIGEVSGRLDEEMARQATQFTEQFDQRLNLLAGVVTKGILLAVVLVVGWRIVQFWLGYYAALNSLL